MCRLSTCLPNCSRRCMKKVKLNLLTLSWRKPLSYRNQSIDLRSKSMVWFLYDNGLRHERVKNMVLCASSDILLSLGESCFQTRKWHYLRHEHWGLGTLKIWNIPVKYWTEKNPGVEYGKEIAKRNKHRKAESNSNILFNKLYFLQARD